MELNIRKILDEEYHFLIANIKVYSINEMFISIELERLLIEQMEITRNYIALQIANKQRYIKNESIDYINFVNNIAFDTTVKHYRKSKENFYISKRIDNAIDIMIHDLNISFFQKKDLKKRLHQILIRTEEKTKNLLIESIRKDQNQNTRFFFNSLKTIKFKKD